MKDKPNLNAVVADIVRRLPDLAQDAANAETVLISLIAPLTAEDRLRPETTPLTALQVGEPLKMACSASILDSPEFILGKIAGVLFTVESELRASEEAAERIKNMAPGSLQQRQATAFKLAHRFLVDYHRDQQMQRSLNRPAQK